MSRIDSKKYFEIPTKPYDFIYLIGTGYGDYVKIGFTRNFERRFAQYRGTVPGFRVYLLLRGNSDNERQLQYKFREFTHTNEWFINREFIVEEVKKLYKNHPDFIIYADEKPNYFYVKRSKRINYPKKKRKIISSGNTISPIDKSALENNFREPLISPADVEKMINIPQVKIKKLARMKILPAIFIGRNTIRFRTSDIVMFTKSPQNLLWLRNYKF